MPTKIILKNSVVQDKAPLPADIDVGELAVNLNENSPAIYGKDTAGNIVKLAGDGAVGTTPPSASETVEGTIELATQAEVNAGIDTSRAVTPATLRNTPYFDTTYVNVTGDTMTGNLTVPSLNGGQLAGFRNIIINGAVNINQRNVDYAAVAVGEYWADRWKKAAAVGAMTQVIEAGNFVPDATYTLSGTGVTTAQITAPSTGDWTLPDIPSTATQIQLELGTVATPFEHRSYGAELALCQRYFCKMLDKDLQGGNISRRYGAGTGTVTYLAGGNSFPVEMRTTPTATIPTISYVNCDGLTVGSGRVGTTIRVIPTSSATFAWNAGIHHFLFDAEL